MGLVSQETKKPAARKTTAAKQEAFTKASAWVNMNIVRKDNSTFKIKRGTPVTTGDDAVLDALEASERKYRAKCIEEGVEYVARTINIQATVQLVDAPADVPDLFE